MKKVFLSLLLLVMMVIPASADVILPEHLTVIEEDAFAGNTSLQGKLVIPEGVTTIGSSAFEGCTGLTGLDLPDSVTVIGDSAFSGCTNLKATVTGEGRDIADSAFEGCSNVSVFVPIPLEDFEYTVAGGGVTITGYKGANVDVAIPATIEGMPVTEIGKQVFYGNENLKSVSLPATVSSICGDAFARCTSLHAVYGAGNVVSYGQRAFGDCSSLASITISNNLTKLEYGVFENCPLPPTTLCLPASAASNISYAYGDSITILYFETEGNEATLTKADFGGAGVRDVHVPSTFDGKPVTKIGRQAFYFSQQLGYIYLPASVYAIEHYAFGGCNNLKAVYGAENVKKIGEGCFSHTPLLDMTLYLLDCDFDNRNHNGSAITIYVFSVEEGEAKLISSYTGQDTMRIPSSYMGLPVTAIDSNSIGRVKHLVIPSTVKVIPEGVAGAPGFSHDTIEMVTFEQPSSLTTIEAKAFEGQHALKSIELPSTLRSIGNEAFAQCRNLTSITLPEGLQTVGEYAFSNTGLTSINIPSNITELPPYFLYGTPLEYFDIPEHVTAIGKGALAKTKLKSIVIPDWVTEFGASLFTNCKELTEVTLPSNMEYLPKWAFYNCKSLQSITLPDSITYIDEMAFMNCINLTSINIPSKVGSILTCVFEGSGLHTQAVERVLGEVIKPGMTDFEKALAIHDWIIYNARYDASAPCFFGSEGVLTFGRGVCQSYTEAYAMLLHHVGIPYKTVESSSMNHTWNLVQLDGEWYHVDVTWDDPLPNGNETHAYFGLSDELMAQDHTWDNPDSLPAATGTRYQYGKDNGAK